MRLKTTRRDSTGARAPAHLAAGTVAAGWLLTLAAPAIAQDEAQTAEGSRGSQLEEVTVTAQFREQNLQETPLAITAITADMLESRSQTNIAEVANQAPNVTLRPGSAPFGPSLQAFIRGVGQSDFNYALEPGVGMYVDDVYYSTLTGSLFDLLDLERVEILRGPQGTLAGQNSIGGAVKLYSRKPTGRDGGFLQVTYGDYDRTDVRAGGDFTLVPDKLFGRIAGVSSTKEGYVTRYDYACTHPGTPIRSGVITDNCELGTEGGKSYTAMRAALRWLASDRVEVNLIGDYSNDDSEASPFTLLYVGSLTGPGVAPAPNTMIDGVLMGTPDGSPFIAYTPLGDFAQDTFSTSPYINYSTYTNPAPVDGTPPYSVPAIYQVDSWGASATVDIALTDTLSLKSISAYRYYDAEWSIDEDNTPIGSTTLYNSVWHRQFTEELRLSGTAFNNGVDYTVGAFYLDREGHYGARVDLRTIQFRENDYVPADSSAAFVNVDWHVTDAMDLIGGVRYTDVEKTFTYGRLGIPGNVFGGLAHPAVRPLDGVEGQFEGDRWDYRVALQYSWTPDLMTYVQYGTGFKSGGVNPRPFFPDQAVAHEPETLDAYEIGLKSDWFDNRLRLNVSAFFNEYQDILMTVNNCPPPSTPVPCAMPLNAGEADVKGFELEGQLFAFGGLSIDSSVSYLDFEYTSISPAALGSGITLDMRAPFTPEWMYSLGAQYSIPFAGGTLTPRLDLSYKDEFFASAINRPPFNVVPDYTLLNGRVSYLTEDEAWQVALEVTNITDELYYLGIFDNRGSSLTVHGQPAPPRQWAVTVRRSF